MTKAICTGSFDPVTNGHIDIFERVAKMFDELIVCIFVNSQKKYLFSTEERLEFLKESTKHISNIKVDSSNGLVTNYMIEHNIKTIVRGLRSSAEFDYEFKEAQMIKYLNSEIDTIFLMTSPEYMFLSSSGVRELIKFKGKVDGLVPKCVEEAIRKLS